MNITIYCGSNTGNDPAYIEESVRLGEFVASRGHTMVYGGGNIGLMGIIADTVLKNGGRVIGVIPEFLIEHEHGHEGLHTLEVVPDMSTRKNRMLELGDVFVAMPGGPGTLEEIAEAISQRRLGLHSSPCVLININGYYEPLRSAFGIMVEKGFLPPGDLENILFIDSVAGLETILKK